MGKGVKSMWRGYISLAVLVFLIFKLISQINTAQAQTGDSVLTPPATAPQKLTCTDVVGDVYRASASWSDTDDCGVKDWNACPSVTDPTTGKTEMAVVQGIHSSTDAWGKVTCYAYCYSLSSNCQWVPAP